MKRRIRLAVRVPLLPSPEHWSGGAKLFFLLVFALFISIGVRSVFGERGIVEWWRLRGKATRLESEVAQVQQILIHEMATIRELRAGEEIIERLARERLGMVKPGEVTYRLYGTTSSTDTTTPRIALAGVLSGDTANP